MKIINSFLFVALVSTVTFFSGCDSDNPENNPPVIDDQIAHYTFEDDVEDQVGNNDGEFQNISFQTVNGANRAAQFTGSSYVLFPEAFDYPERTVSLWFKALAVTDVLGVIYGCDNNSIDYGMTIFSVINNAQGDPILQYNACDQLFSVGVSENEWYHVVTTVDDDSYAFYLNGEKIDVGEFEAYNHSGSGQTGALLGTSPAFAHYFIGQVDNMRVYERAISEEEVAELYEAEEN